jgi:UDP-N-acetylmuramate dehydrogenase
LLGEIKGEIRFKELLGFHTSLRIGGPADIFVIPQDVEDIRHALRFAQGEGLPVAVIGGGNGVLVTDRGFRGVVMKLEGCLGHPEFHGEEVVAGAGAGLSALIRKAAGQDLGGIEALVGIPATVGGALVTNAGTAEGSITDFLSTVYFIYADGQIGEIRPDHRTFSFREEMPEGSILVGCRLQLHKRPYVDIQKDIKTRLRAERAASRWRSLQLDTYGSSPTEALLTKS